MRHLHEAAVTALLVGSLLGAAEHVDAGGLCACPVAGTVLTQSKISATAGVFNGQLDNTDLFGSAVASVGDLNSDGIPELVVGTPFDDDGGLDRGAVWLLFLDASGAVTNKQKIANGVGGFPTLLHNSDAFGSSVAALGDIDADGVADIAVGAMNDDDGGPDHGAVWVLRMNRNGTVKAQQKISSLSGGFTGQLDVGDAFGVSVASPGDLNSDGVPDLVVGASGDDDGGLNRGALWVLLLNSNGAVIGQQKIAAFTGGFTGQLHDADAFGTSLARVGDLDGNGAPDLAVGAPLDDDGGSGRGALWLLFLKSNGTVQSQKKISSLSGGFAGQLDNLDSFGSSAASLGDIDGDGIADLAVGAMNDDDGGADRGAMWILLMNGDGTVKDQKKISGSSGGFLGQLDNADAFGVSVARVGDLNGDGISDLAVGANRDDDGGTDRGAVWIVSLVGCLPTPAPVGDFNNDCSVNGADLAVLLGAWTGPAGDLNNDGTTDGADLAILLGAWTG